MSNTHTYYPNPDAQPDDYKRLMLSDEEIQKALSTNKEEEGE